MERTAHMIPKPLWTRRTARRMALLLLLTAIAALIGYRGQNMDSLGTQPAPAGLTTPQPITADPPPAARSAPESQAQARPTLLDQAMAFIEPFEGREYRAYRDSRGNMTIGIGFNLDRPGAAEDIRRLLPGISYRALRRGDIALTDAQIDTLLRHDARRAIDTARRQIADFDTLPRDAQLILIDMTYNTGSLHKWRNLRSALARQDYAAAADAMHQSRWRRQTGLRARHLIAMMRDIADG